MTTAKIFRLAVLEAQRQHARIVDAEPMTQDELDDAVDDVLADWEADAAEDRELYGEPLDTDCIENGRNNCDDWGTGEGRFHGRI